MNGYVTVFSEKPYLALHVYILNQSEGNLQNQIISHSILKVVVN